MAALTSSGARNASEIVLLILRGLHRSLLAMLSVVAFGSVTISSSHARARAIDATSVARVSDRMGRIFWVGDDPLSGSRISRRLTEDVLCQAISRGWPTLGR